MIKNGRLYPGMSIRLQVTITNADGETTEPDGLKLQVYDPCGRRTEYVYGTDDEVTREGVGAYLADLVPNIAGRWHYRWVTTGDFDQPILEEDFIVLTSPFVDNCCRDYA
jgi:hypothetical protein